MPVNFSHTPAANDPMQTSASGAPWHATPATGRTACLTRARRRSKQSDRPATIADSCHPAESCQQRFSSETGQADDAAPDRDIEIYSVKRSAKSHPGRFYQRKQEAERAREATYISFASRKYPLPARCSRGPDKITSRHQASIRCTPEPAPGYQQ